MRLQTDSPKALTVLASFEADAPCRECGLHFHSTPAVETCSQGSDCLLKMRPSGDYYTEDAWAFSFANPQLAAHPNIVLELEYLDNGFGVIAARRLVEAEFRPVYAGPVRAVSYTRLNTGRLRRAAFAFDRAVERGAPSAAPHIEITGIQHLKAARVYPATPDAYWTRLADDIPVQVPPVTVLDRPLDVVCSVPGAFGGTSVEAVAAARAELREALPLAKALGFNAIESYVRWNFVEPEPGRFDWSLYDAVVDEVQRRGLKWFPLLIVGSAYTLPNWFAESPENIGFECLEHGLTNPIQSIWSPYHKKHVTRFLQAFGEHYEPKGCLQGVRLGPSGNYGESQYPAGGNWGFKGEPMHIHIGMWCGDAYAQEDFRRFLRSRYATIEELNAAWAAAYRDFEDVRPMLPEQCLSKRQRIDLYTWYTDSMSEWCEWWAVEARRAMPNTPIYQSAGGWGAAEIGTDYSAQTRSMRRIAGGIRLTNELDSFHQCCYATRLAATAARLYGVPLGFEPAMGHTARGVAGRLFNCITNNGAHFFTYHGNIFSQQTAVETWLAHYSLLDARGAPLVETAVYYPQTMNFLSHDTFRFLNAWGFNPYAREIRNHVEIDYLDDRLIQDGFLPRYKALIFVWGEYVEQRTLEEIDRWLRAGGAVIFPYFLNMQLASVEDDTTIFRRWTRGDVGAGRFFRYVGDDEPPSRYAAYVRSILLRLPTLSDATRTAIELHQPDKVFISVREDGSLFALNFSDEPARLAHERIEPVELAPYSIRHIPLR